jgi:hypothetical protein
MFLGLAYNQLDKIYKGQVEHSNEPEKYELAL